MDQLPTQRFKESSEEEIAQVRRDFENNLLEQASEALGHHPFKFRPDLVPRAAKDLILNHKRIFDGIDQCDDHDQDSPAYHHTVDRLYRLSDLYAFCVPLEFVWMKLPCSHYNSFPKALEGFHLNKLNIFRFLEFQAMLELYPVCEKHGLQCHNCYSYDSFFAILKNTVENTKSLKVVSIFNGSVSQDGLHFENSQIVSFETLKSDIANMFVPTLILPKVVEIVFPCEVSSPHDNTILSTNVLKVTPTKSTQENIPGSVLRLSNLDDLSHDQQTDYLWWKDPELFVTAAAGQASRRMQDFMDKNELPGYDYVDSQ